MSKEIVGFLGAGQLAAMMIKPVHDLGYGALVLDSTPNSPAAKAGAKQIFAPVKDEAGTIMLAASSDYVTYDTEHINAEVLIKYALEKSNPSPKTVMLIQDKLTQKEALRKANLPTPHFAEISDKKDLLDFAKEYSFPVVLKKRRDAFDGRGNNVIRTVEDIDAALTEFKGHPLYAEEWIKYKKELAIIMARSKSGDIAIYPLVETFHENNICHMVLAPAPVSPKVHQQAKELGLETMKLLEGTGDFATEMFLDEDGNLKINEIAPRVHNSGHFTEEACITSQFKQQILAVTGQQLGDPAMKFPAAVMFNILGEKNRPAQYRVLEEAQAVPNVGIHIYGKEEEKPERKMGHITATGNTLGEAREKAVFVRTRITND